MLCQLQYNTNCCTAFNAIITHIYSKYYSLYSGSVLQGSIYDTLCWVFYLDKIRTLCSCAATFGYHTLSMWVGFQIQPLHSE